MHHFDFDHQGFEWLSCDDIDNSILAFIRSDGKKSISCVFNFTPATLEDYVLGVPEAGTYEEIFNSDAAWYGGTDVGNGGVVETNPRSEHGFENTLTLTIPPLAALFLKKVDE